MLTGRGLPRGSLAAASLPTSRLMPEPLPASRLALGPAASASSLQAPPRATSRLGAAPGAASRLGAAPNATGGLAPAPMQPSLLRTTETERGTLVSMPGDVLFDFDAATIRPDARPVLDELARLIATTTGPVAIEGHTDAKGPRAYNQDLSERRAASVADYLANVGGVERARLTTRGFGEDRPVAPNATKGGRDDPEGRQRNRRVEAVISNG